MTKQDNAGGEQPWAAGLETFERLVDFAFDVALIGDASARFRYVSPAVERVFGYRPEDVVGREAWDFIHPDDHARAWQALGEALAHPGRHVVSRLRVRDAQGSWRLVESAAV